MNNKHTHPYSENTTLADNLLYTVQFPRPITVFDDPLSPNLQSIIAIRNVSWLVAGGTTFQIQPYSTTTIVGNITTLAQRVLIPLALTYSCEDNTINPPVRTIANVTIWTLAKNCSFVG